MDDRDRALDEIAVLARRHGLTAADIAAVLGRETAPAADDRRRGALVRVLAYLGGTFVFAGVGVFIALQWDRMGPAARVIITLGPGLVAFALAVLASRDARFDKATTPLLLMAGALEPTGMTVAFAEFGSGGDWRWASLVTTATMALQFGVASRALSRGTPLFLTVLFATLFWWTAFDLLDVDGTVTALILGGALLLTAAGLDRAGYRQVTGFWYFVGAFALLAGLFDVVEGTVFEILFLAAAAGLVYLSVVLRSRVLLFVATMAILAYTGWFTGEHFADSVGWPIALILIGVLMIGLSAAAFRIDRRYVRGPR